MQASKALRCRPLAFVRSRSSAPEAGFSAFSTQSARSYGFSEAALWAPCGHECPAMSAAGTRTARLQPILDLPAQRRDETVELRRLSLRRLEVALRDRLGRKPSTSRSAFSKSRTVRMSAVLTALVRASSFTGNVTSETSGGDLMVLMVRRGSFGLVPRVNSPTV